MDLYEYAYNGQWRIGNSPVKVNSEIKAGALPTFQEMVRIDKKIGIDQHLLNVKERDNALWLQALIWPDQMERFQRLKQAIQLAQNASLQLIQANKVEEFKAIIQAQSKDQPTVIYHTHVLYQFTPEERFLFRKMLDEIGLERDLYYLAVEAKPVFDQDYGPKGVQMVLTTYQNGIKDTQFMGLTNGHAKWIEWGRFRI